MHGGKISALAPDAFVADVADGWLLQDPDGGVIDVHLASGELFGWTAGDLIGLDGEQLVHPDDRDIVWRMRSTARSGSGDQWIRLRVRSSTGDWYWAELHFVGVDGADGYAGRCTVVSIADVSAAHVGPETLELAAELRRSFTSAESARDGWSKVLSRVVRATKSSAAVVWERAADTRIVAHGWAVTPEGEAVVDARRKRACSDQESGLGRAWNTGLTVDSEIDDVCTGSQSARMLPGHASRLIPLQTDREVHCVVELIHRDDSPRLVPVGVALAELGDNVLRRELERDLSLGELRFGNTFHEAPIGMALIAPNGAFMAANKALCEFLGRGEAELKELGFQEITHPDDLAADEAFVAEMLAGTRIRYSMEKRYFHADGTVRWAELSVSLVRLRGEPVHFISQIVDIDNHKRVEREFEQSRAMLRAAFDHSRTSMALVHLDVGRIGEIVSANAAFQQLCGVGSSGKSPNTADVAFDRSEADRFELFLRRLLEPGAAEQRGEFKAATSAREDRWLDVVVAPVAGRSDSDRMAMVHLEDITEQRRVRDELHHVALHDSLTGLPNRSLILDRIHTAQARSEQRGRHFGVLYIDLDRFKEVNDSFGHDAGDDFLREVSRRFTGLLRPHDTVARLSGDEFIFLCEELDGDFDAALTELSGVADRVHAALEVPVKLAGREVLASASVGIAASIGDELDVDAVVSNADVALYRAKTAGRGRSVAFGAEVSRESNERIRLGADLNEAQAQRQLYVSFQPIVEITTGEPCAAEALLRWAHPEMGEVPPGRFIVIAEESDLIVEVGEFVLDEAVRTVADDASLGYVTVNVSARQLVRSDFAATVERVLNLHGVDPSRLALELTENVLMDTSGETVAQLERIRDMGVRIGVDDFGTGYSSLAYVKRLPLSFVKLDRSFVSGLVDDEADRSIASAVVGLTKALGLDLIAEGVETQGQVDVLTELGCTYAQGFLFGHPEPKL